MLTYRLSEIDFAILEALADGRRNVVSNLTQEVDYNRSYINNELARLTDQRLLERVGPAEKSGLYQITASGVAALEKRELYESDRKKFTREVQSLSETISIEEPSIHIGD